MKAPDRASLAGKRCAASAVHSLPLIGCKGCGVDVQPVVFWNKMHLQGNCPRCGKYVKNLSQVTPWIELAPPKIIELRLFKDAA
jgi:hypothetical protein